MVSVVLDNLAAGSDRTAVLAADLDAALAYAAQWPERESWICRAPTEAAKVLRQAGFEAETVWDESLAGADDASISSAVRSEARIRITLDLDFSNIRNYPPDQHPGLIALRLKHQDKSNTIAVMKRLTLALGRRSPAGELWIVEEDRIRFRPGKPLIGCGARRS